MHEYALMVNTRRLPGSTRIFQGTITTIVQTFRSLAELKDSGHYDAYEIVPIDEVPQRALLDYGFWNQRS